LLFNIHVILFPASAKKRYKNVRYKPFIRLLTLYTEQRYLYKKISVSVRELVSESMRLQTLFTPNWSTRVLSACPNCSTRQCEFQLPIIMQSIISVDIHGF